MEAAGLGSLPFQDKLYRGDDFLDAKVVKEGKVGRPSSSVGSRVMYVAHRLVGLLC